MSAGCPIVIGRRPAPNSSSTICGRASGADIKRRSAEAESGRGVFRPRQDAAEMDCGALGRRNIGWASSCVDTSMRLPPASGGYLDALRRRVVWHAGYPPAWHGPKRQRQGVSRDESSCNMACSSAKSRPNGIQPKVTGPRSRVSCWRTNVPSKRGVDDPGVAKTG